MRDEREAVIQYRDVGKRFAKGGDERSGTLEVLNDINLRIYRNQFVSLIGPSGCGKTTMLRMCSGLILPSSGELHYKDWIIKGLNRDVGFITQDSNLFPWMTLKENVEFPLLVRGVPPAERRDKIEHYVQMVGLGGFENYYPAQLSGGMQKRASIIRTLIYDPDIVLMDEPFGPLDAQTRVILQDELLGIWERNKKTIVFVTHDLVEAVALSDVVVLLTKGPGTIKKVFDIKLDRPRNVFEIHAQEGFAEIYHEIWTYFKPEVKVRA